MTLQELCKKYNLTESSVTTNFPRTQNMLLKKYGVTIVKNGRGKTATYEEGGLGSFVSDQRALTMFNETHKEMVFNQESLTLINADFLVFLGIISTPMGVFRGTYSDFLRYVGITVSKDNLEMLEDALLNLVDRELIYYNTDDDSIVMYIRRKVEKEMKIGIEMIKRCRILADKYNKHKNGWINLLKVWIAIQVCSYDPEPFTNEQLSQMTNLSLYQVKNARKILKEDNLFVLSRAGDALKCFGSRAVLNAFYN